MMTMTIGELKEEIKSMHSEELRTSYLFVLDVFQSLIDGHQTDSISADDIKYLIEKSIQSAR